MQGQKQNRNGIRTRRRTGSVRSRRENPKGTHDTTLRELLVWLVRRHRLRRRYQTDNQKHTFHRQVLFAALFLFLMLFVSAFSMTYVRLHTQAAVDTYRVTLGHTEISRNPVLEAGDVNCAVTVRIGTEEPFIHNTRAMTVGDMLLDIGYQPGADDVFSVPADTIVEDGMQVNIICVTYEESTEVVALPYGTVYEDVQTIPRGATQRISYGTDGVAKQTLRRRYENGEAVSWEVLSSETITPPVDEVLMRGTGGVVYGNAGAFRYSYYIDVTATAYGGYAEPRYTYSGTVAREGVIAVDPDVIPLGTKVYVTGNYGDFGVCYAEDIGSGIKGHHIDIYMDATLEEMLEFGFRSMRVYILE